MASVTVRMRGPLLEGRDPALTARMCEEIRDDVAAQAYSEVMGNLNTSIRHPTPYYETQITTDKVGRDVARVHDRGIVYGPWLEGTGSRNRTTRFKGYASFRRARQALEGKVGHLVAGVVSRWVGRL